MIINKTNVRIMSQRDIQESVMAFWSYSTDCVSEHLDPHHYHSQKVEFTLFLEGRGIYRIEGKDYEIRPGDLFFLGERKLHYIPEITEPLRIINLCFEPRFIWSQSTRFEDTHYLQLLFHLGKGVPCKFDADCALTARLKYLMLEMEQESIFKKSDYISAIRSMIILMLIELSRYAELSGEQLADTIPNIDYQSMNHSMNFINENLDCQLTLAEIAKTANLSPTYYCNLFKKLNGITLWEYITPMSSNHWILKENCFMCNIAGYAGHKQAAPILIEMLKRQEAYDAGIFTGIATIHEGRLYYRKVYGTAATLEQETDALSLPGTIGIIHGRPGGTPDTFFYSHPFVPDAENRAFVLNGTCPDNHLSKQRSDGAQKAADAGYHFRSARYAEKDSYPQLQNGQYVAIGEVIMHLTDYYRKQGYCQQEAFALAASDEYTDLVALMLDLETPDVISALRISRPMYLLKGEGENFLATCPFAFPLRMQDQCISLPLLHVCEITRDACTVTGIRVQGEAVCSITPYAYAEAYRRVVDLLTGRKDHPLVYDDVEIAILNMTDLWPEQHTCSPYAQLAYEVLLQLQREGRLRQEIRNQPYAAGNTTRPRAMLWLE